MASDSPASARGGTRPPDRWYLTPAGRLLRAAIGLPILAAAACLFWLGGVGGVGGGIIVALWGLSLPWAAVVQEPD